MSKSPLRAALLAATLFCAPIALHAADAPAKPHDTDKQDAPKEGRFKAEAKATDGTITATVPMHGVLLLSTTRN